MLPISPGDPRGLGANEQWRTDFEARGELRTCARVGSRLPRGISAPRLRLTPRTRDRSATSRLWSSPIANANFSFRLFQQMAQLDMVSGNICGHGGGGGNANPIDPLLGPLQMNGGSTPTQALLWGSRAIDQGNCFGIHSDQRGQHRPHAFASIAKPHAGDGGDIGAFELENLPSHSAEKTPGRFAPRIF